MADILAIGLRSLMTFQSAIQTTAQNLENARTPFYSRRQVQLVSAMFNNGVNIGDVKRIYDETSNQSLLASTSSLLKLDSFYSSIADFEKVLDSDSNSVSKYLNDSVKSLQELTKDVASPQLRSSYLSKLGTVANQLQSLGSEISRRANDTNQNIQTVVSAANVLISQIGALNGKIQVTTDASLSDLMDQRNALVHQLSEYMDFTTSTDSYNNVNISLSNGLQVINGSITNTMSATPNPNDNSRLTLSISQNGGATINIDSFINGGQLAGLVKYRNEALDVAQRGLGRLALILEDAFNKQNKLGMDTYGSLGQNIFTDINDSLMASARVQASNNNTGSGVMSVSITSASQLVASDYTLSFTDPTHYTLTRQSDNSVVTSGVIAGFPATISADGFTTTITSGTFSAGDMYYIKPTANALTQCQVTQQDAGRLALAYPVDAVAQSANTGTGVINVDSITDTTTADFSLPGQLNPPIKISFLTPTTYQVVNASTNAVIEGPITYDPTTTNSVFPTPLGYDPGYRISLTGNINTGDTFNVNYNTNGAGDNRNALQFVNLYSNKLIENGTLTFNDSYRFISNDISLKTNLAKGQFDSAVVLNKQAESRYDQFSGVSDVEEMNNLAEYQQSYQACAEVVQIGRSIFDTIIRLVG